MCCTTGGPAAGQCDCGAKLVAGPACSSKQLCCALLAAGQKWCSPLRSAGHTAAQVHKHTTITSITNLNQWSDLDSKLKSFLKLSDQFKVIDSGSDWISISMQQTIKGAGLARQQQVQTISCSRQRQAAGLWSSCLLSFTVRSPGCPAPGSLQHFPRPSQKYCSTTD